MKYTKLQQARIKNEIARLELDTLLLARRQKIVAEYDATSSSVKRRQPRNEYKNEDGILPMLLRQKAVNIGRDLERNYSPAKSILHQFRVNVVGELGKLMVNIAGGKNASDWFNQVYAKDCDYREPGMHLSEVFQNVVAGVVREGDMLTVVDDDLIEDTGKLAHWESDQIVPLADNILPAQYKGATQENGIIRGKWGKLLAWIVTGKHGIGMISDIKDATIWTRENACHVKNPWRINQGRGIPSVLTSASNFVDLYEILSKELQSAKVAAGNYASIKRTNAVTNWDTPALNPEYLPENAGKTAAEVATEPANHATNTGQNYDRLEAFTGGYTDYLNVGDEVDIPDIKRPNVHLMEFCDAVLGHAGASVGLARAYTILRADSSYTAFRGDMILSWVTFYAMQKWLERRYADWIAKRVLRWAMRKKEIKPLPAGWERAISWKWPTMPHVDEARESIAESQSLKNGTLDYSDLLGPEWETKFEAFAGQLNKGRELGLPLSVFEQKSGGAAPSETRAASDPDAGDTGEENPNKKKE